MLLHAGRILDANLAKERLSRESVLQALREHGIATVQEVKLAVLEVDGSISVLKNDEMPTTPRPHHRIRFLQRKS